jgi:hypothetical protein
MGNHTYPRTALLLEEELTDEFKTSGIVLKIDQLNTVSDIIDCAKKMEGWCQKQNLSLTLQGNPTVRNTIANMNV